MGRKQWGSQENNSNVNNETNSKKGRTKGWFNQRRERSKHKGMAKCPILVMSFLYVIGNYI